MIRRLIKNWLGVTRLEDVLITDSGKMVDTVLNSSVLASRIVGKEGTPVYPDDDPHDPVIVEKPITKGYVKS